NGSGGSQEGQPPSYDGYELSFYAGGMNEGSARVDEKGEFQVDLPPNKKYKVVVARVKETFGPTAGPPGGNRSQAAPPTGVVQEKGLEKFRSASSTPIEIEVGGSNTEVTIDLSKY
ncbi:MAG: hypothetical protein D6743_16375, partial [Calditrichaeota bacterium]